MSRALRSGRLEKKRRIRAAALAGAIAASSGLMCYGTYRLVNAEWSQVALTDVLGSDVLSREQLLSASVEALAEPRSVVPRTSAIFFDAQHVAETLSAAFPRILTADVKRTGWRSAVLIVSERAPAAFACTGATCVSIDEAGRAFADAPAFAISDLPVIEAADLPSIGSEFLPAQSLLFITEAWEGIRLLGMKPVRAHRAEDDLRIDLSSGSVLISARLPLQESLEVLRAAARQDPTAPVIDVRFPGKVIYRDGQAPAPGARE